MTRTRRDTSFDEWLKKSPARGGTQTAIAPGAGMVGRYAPPGSPVFDSFQSQSKYALEPREQPQPWIDDVDMGSNFYSPFQPVWPFGPPYVNQPREWDFPTGYNLNYINARMQLMEMLRAMRNGWGVLATVIATRQDQLLRIPWTIQVRDKPRAKNAGVEAMRRFFKRPDGKLSYSQWTRKLTDDLLVIDAPTLWFPRDMGGRILAAEVINGACYSADTEVLTKRGWLHFNETFKDDEFATRNPITKEFEWQKAHYFHCEDWTGKEMIQFKSRTLDLFVTPTHRMLVQSKSTVFNGGNAPEKIVLAEDVAKTIGNWCIPQTSIWDAKPIREVTFRPTNVRGADYEQHSRGKLPSSRKGSIAIVKQCESCGENFTVHPYREKSARFCSDRCRRQGLAKTVVMSGDDFCAFMGMWLAEGCIVDNDRILISQQKESKGFEEFKELLTRIEGGKEPYYNPGNGYWDLHARCMYTYLEQFGHATEKFIPEVIKNASKDQLKIFWHYYMLGDGYFENARQSIATSSYRMAGDLQEIAQKLGLSAGVYAKKEAEVAAEINGRKIIPTTTQYTVRLRNSTHIGVESAEYINNYEGNVYCVSVPNEALYVRRNGRPTWCLNTIFPLIDDTGRRPDSKVVIDEDGITYLQRQPAFQQIIKGQPMIDLDESELLYCPMRPRPEMPIFGYAPTEQILNETVEAVLKTGYQRKFWDEGTIPDLIVTVPNEWTPRQIAMFQAHFDAMLSGNLNLKSKVRFLPGGMKPFDIKNSSGESLWSQRDEMLIRLCCYAYSVSPTPFIHQTNRATAQNAQQTAEEEGLYPLMSWWKDDIMDYIIQKQFGFEDVEFTFLPKPETDQKKRAEVHQILFNIGVEDVNEIRDEYGMEPIEDGDVHFLVAGGAPVPLSGAASGQIGQPGDPQAQGNPKPQSAPQGGRSKAQPGVAKSPVEELIDDINGLLAKREVSNRDVKDAAKQSDGDIDNASHLQLKVGNYKKGHIYIQGLNITIENEKGSYRGEKDQHGKKWQVKMPTAYGYIRGTMGADNMQMDVYLGKHPMSKTVWVIDQDKITDSGQNKGFDEHKVMLGYSKLKRALKDYLKSHFDGHGHERIHNVVELSIDEFKKWLKKGDMKEPISDQGYGEVVLDQKDMKKADTISQSTGLLHYDQISAAGCKRKKKKALKSGPRWMELVA